MPVLLWGFKVYVVGLANVHGLLTLLGVCVCVCVCACVHIQIIMCCSVPEIMAMHILCVLTG
jgi:hypothetical protein